MRDLRKGIRDYLMLRRGLGFKLVKHEAGLEEFASFLERKRGTHITSELALEWATLPAHHQPCQWTARLTIVRGFARYWSAVDPVTEVPPLGLLPYRPTRARPYFYSDQEIQQLLKAAKARPSCDPLRPWTYHCFFGLLAVTGLRLSEAVNLHAEDLDWSEGILTIRGAKFGKSRLVPLHASTCKVLADYAKRRDRRFGPRAEAHFFVNKNGNRLDQGEVHRMFYNLSRQIGLRAAGGGRGPRLHDFRHRFALETLLRWYRNGEDPERRLPILSTYLGHAHVTDTYWYLTGTPELLPSEKSALTRSPPTGIRFACCCSSHRNGYASHHPSWIWITWTHLSSERSWITWRPVAATVLAAATCVSLRCGPFSATRHWRRRCTPGPFNACWRFPTNDSHVPWLVF